MLAKQKESSKTIGRASTEIVTSCKGDQANEEMDDGLGKSVKEIGQNPTNGIYKAHFLLQIVNTRTSSPAEMHRLEVRVMS